MEILLLVWLPLCIAVAILANRYNRNPIVWIVLSVVFSPLIGAAFVLALGPMTEGPDLRSDEDMRPKPDTSADPVQQAYIRSLAYRQRW
jgi:hypothetical protein